MNNEAMHQAINEIGATPAPTQENAELRAMLAAMQAEIRALNNQLLEQTATQPLPTTTEPQPAPAPMPATYVETRRPRPCLPDVTPFTGKRSDYLVWSLSARQKIKLDAPSIGGPAEQYSYLFERMSTAAQNIVVARFQSGLDNPDPTAFLTYLDTQFIDPNAANRAMSKLQELRQRDNEPFSAFLPRFERLLHESGLADHRSSIANLTRALIPSLRRALSYIVGKPLDYPGFCALCFTVSSQIEEVEMYERGASPRHRPPTNLAPTHSRASRPATEQDDAMDWEPTGPVRTRGLAPLTSQERDRLRSTGGCFRCRQAGHLAAQCPDSNRHTEDRRVAVRPASTIGPSDNHSQSENEEL